MARNSAIAAKRPAPPAAVSVRHGDAYDLLATLPARSVDLLITSPPYWGHRIYSADHNWETFKAWKGTAKPGAVPPYEWYRAQGGAIRLEPLPEWYVAHLIEIFERARSALKPTASMWINIGDTYFARWSSIRPQ